MPPVVRVSILRCEPEQFPELKRMMTEAKAVLDDGIRKMHGLIDYESTFRLAERAPGLLSRAISSR